MTQVYVIDFDGVLFDQNNTKQFYPEAIQVIRRLKQENQILAIATRRSGNEADEAIQLLKTEGIDQFFDIIVADCQPKPFHLNVIRNFLNIKYPNKDFLLTLYDDFDVNISDVIKAGFQAILINNQTGLQITDIKNKFSDIF